MRKKHGHMLLRVGLTLLSLLLLVLGIVLAISLFHKSNSVTIETRNRSYIEERALEIQSRLDDDFSSAISSIGSMAYFYGRLSEVTDTDELLLNDIEDRGVFDIVRFLDTDGRVCTSDGLALTKDGQALVCADLPFFQLAMEGQSGISYVSSSHVTGDARILFYAPVYKNGGICGVLVGEYTEATIVRLISAEYYSCQADSLLLLQDGNILMGDMTPTLSSILDSTSDPDNIFSLLTRTDILDAENADYLRDHLETGATGVYAYNGVSGESYGCVVRLRSAPFILLHTFPSPAQATIVSTMNQSGQTLQKHITILFILYIVALLIIWGSSYLSINQKYRSAHHMARIDGLTGAYNRLAWDEELLALSLEEDPEYCVAIFDIDLLKKANDERGHEAGDELVCATASLLSSVFRREKIFRTGGDEFAVLLWCKEDEARSLIAKLRKQAADWQGKLVPSLSLSCGLATELDGKTPKEVARMADIAMYHEKATKHNGRT